jgi:FAD dependent oxidoreductase TIGR03364
MPLNAIVIGAGIAGLAMARTLALKGYQVRVIERSGKAVGASIRNFGMVWPVGQPEGEMYETALRTSSIWKQLCNEAGIWYDEVGSLHLAYAKDEWEVMNEYVSAADNSRSCRLLKPAEINEKSGAVINYKLQGGLFNPDEVIIDSRKAIAMIPAWLEEKHGVEFTWGRAVTAVRHPYVEIGAEKTEADLIVVCSGADFESLFPELYSRQSLTKCKLQMMRMVAQPGNWRIGPALCGSLSLVHYKGFASAPSLHNLRQRYQQEYADYLQWGIHVMVAQNEAGELTIGDSHEYGDTHDPFDKMFINQLILDYLKSFARFRDERLIETWNGILPKLTDGTDYLVLEPENGVFIFNGLGGAGMTLSFGLAEKIMEGI